MIERVIILDAVDPVTFYGVNNANVQVIKNLFPKVRIAARGNVMKVIGDEKETELFEQKIKQLEKYCAEYNQLGEEVIIDIIKGDEPQTVKPLENLIIYGVNGKPSRAARPTSRSWSRLLPTTTSRLPWGRPVRARPTWLLLWP